MFWNWAETVAAKMPTPKGRKDRIVVVLLELFVGMRERNTAAQENHGHLDHTYTLPKFVCCPVHHDCRQRCLMR